MIFHQSPIAGCITIELEFHKDTRGRFGRTFCAEEFAIAGLETKWVQMNSSRTSVRGTVRGLHYQRGRHAEVKVVRCTSGAIFDVAVDLRMGSATFGMWTAAELTSESGAMFYVPKGCAHGFQALTDDAEVAYMCSAPYSPDNEGGLLATDPGLAIDWPLPVLSLSTRDAAMPLLTDLEPL